MDLRKALFQSPGQNENCKEKKACAGMETLLNKIQVEIEIENNLNIVEKELHEKRVSKMKEEVKRIEEDAWMYDRIQDYVGF